MADLRALEREFHDACASMMETEDDKTRYPRVHKALKLISTRRPTSVADCVVKLRTLVERQIRLGGTTDDQVMEKDDVTSLSQVIAFLADFDKRRPG